jgi:hypothetical protein
MFGPSKQTSRDLDRAKRMEMKGSRWVAERENWRRVMRKETFSALRWGWKEKKERKKRERSAGLWKM